MGSAVLLADIDIAAAQIVIAGALALPARLEFELTAAVGAKKQAGKRMYPVFLVRPPARNGRAHRLHFIPCVAVDDRRVRVLLDDVFVLGNIKNFMVLVRKARRQMLRHPAGVGGIAQNFGNGARRPIAQVPPHRLFAVQPRVVCRGVGDALVGERARDRPIGAARKAHIVDTPHDVCRLLVDDCRALFVRSRLVAVGVRPVGVLALFPVGF